MAGGTPKLKPVLGESKNTNDTAGQEASSSSAATRPGSPKKTKGKKEPQGNMEKARRKLSLPIILPPRPGPAVPEVTALYVRPFNPTGFNTSLSSATASGSGSFTLSNHGMRTGTRSTLPYTPNRRYYPSSATNSARVNVQPAKEETAVNQSPKSTNQKGKKVNKPFMTLEEARRSLSLHNAVTTNRPPPTTNQKSAPIQRARPQEKTSSTFGNKGKTVPMKVRGTTSAPVPPPSFAVPPKPSGKKVTPVATTVDGDKGSTRTNGKEKGANEMKVGTAVAGVGTSAPTRTKKIRFADEVSPVPGGSTTVPSPRTRPPR